jgi:putative membrane protein
MGRFDEWVRAVGTDPDPRFTLANERTFLSWMTTALGLLAAFVAVRALARWFRLERAMRIGQALPLSSSIPFLAAVLAVLSLVSGVVVLAAG